MFILLWTLGTLDYSTVFSLAPYINENITTIIGICLLIGAMAKSSQVGLHIWLPMAMEGLIKTTCLIQDIYLIVLYIYYNKISRNTYKCNKAKVHSSFLKVSKRGIHTMRKSYIWVYDITNLYIEGQVDNCLVNIAPFTTKTECANFLKTTRNTITSYLDSGKIFNNKLIFSSIELSKEELLKLSIPNTVWEVITGELLGDGHISCDPINKPLINGRLEFTFAATILHYVNYLKFNVLASICTTSNPTPWPKTDKGQQPSQYWFSTKRLPALTTIHSLWYKEIEGKYIKVLPDNIESLLTPIGLAHWIMGDGYFTNGSTKICTDNFTKEEVLILMDILVKKFAIKATINKRTNPDGTIKWRINISKLSMDKLISIVQSYVIPEMLYKLGLKKSDYDKQRSLPR
jgi:hypothetical protein